MEQDAGGVVGAASAHVLSARFRHDITGHAAGYIASWVAGDPDRLRHLHDRVGKVTTALVPPDQLDRLLSLAHARAADRDQSRGQRRRR